METITCPKCKGQPSFRDLVGNLLTCNQCFGAGEVPAVLCIVCEDGTLDGEDCPECDGAGMVPADEEECDDR